MNLKKLRKFSKLSNSNLTYSEVYLIKTLSYHSNLEPNGLKISELAHELEMTPSGVTQLVTNLENKNYVKRVSDSSDKRIVRIVLMDTFNKSCNNSEHLLYIFENLVEHLGEDDCLSLIRIVTKCVDFSNKK